VRLDDVELVVAAAACAIEAGLAAVEVTFTLTGAADAIRRLRRDHPDALVGAGTVRSDAELDAAAEAGATCAIQPGGSVRDEEVVAAANERNMAMIFTVLRHFRH